jgi:hypothetical protein
VFAGNTALHYVRESTAAHPTPPRKDYVYKIKTFLLFLETKADFGEFGKHSLQIRAWRRKETTVPEMPRFMKTKIMDKVQ